MGFTICPELIASLLFTEAMMDNEAVLVTGAEQYCSYSGYGDTFCFEGQYKDTTEVDSSNRKLTSVVAMDAIKFSKGDSEFQFRAPEVLRELKKAFVAFFSPGRSRLEAVATGNWGCGAFGGDVRLKLILQLLAASEADRDVAYFTFGDEQLLKEGGELYEILAANRVTVGKLFDLVQCFIRSNKRKNGEELFNWIRGRLTGEETEEK